MKTSEFRKLIREEALKALNEEPKKNLFYTLGFEVGPNKETDIDPNSKEAKIIMSKLDLPLIQLEKDPAIVAFTKGRVDSSGSSDDVYDGIASIAPLLLRLKKKGWPKSGRIL